MFKQEDNLSYRQTIEAIAEDRLPEANRITGRWMLLLASFLGAIYVTAKIGKVPVKQNILTSLVVVAVCMIVVGAVGIISRVHDKYIKHIYYLLFLLSIYLVNLLTDLGLMVLFIFPVVMSSRYCSRNFNLLVFAESEIMVILCILANNHSGDFWSKFVSLGIPILGLVVISTIVLFSLMERNFDVYAEATESRLKQKEYEEKLTDARRKLTMSQVQPHFIYNTLNSIAALCDIDPQKAKQLTIDFTNYIRTNLNTLDQSTNIPFTKELEHTKTYLNIEQVRFADKLNVQWDITAEDFEIPPLTLQPFVENAVKHGICQKEDGGTLYISSYEYDDRFEVTCRDTGVGFTQEEIEAQKNDTRSHIGINNVSSRVHDYCGGRIEVESVKGEGTTITIIIPKARNSELK